MPPEAGARRPLRRAALLAIRAYQLSASALLGRQCRYLPTCSDYAAEAIARDGLWVGGWIATARLCRCHPLGPWGYDPVPPRRAEVPAARPWRHGAWRLAARAEEAGQERANSSAASP